MAKQTAMQELRRSWMPCAPPRSISMRSSRASTRFWRRRSTGFPCGTIRRRSRSRSARAFASASRRWCSSRVRTKRRTMIEFLVDSKTRPPVAIYSSFRDDAAAAPAAKRAGSRPAAIFGLVPAGELFARAGRDAGGPGGWRTDRLHGPAALCDRASRSRRRRGSRRSKPAPKAPPQHRRRDLDEIAPQSEFYRLLAKAAGYRSWNETWDALFETPRTDRTCEELRREVALFCAAVRATGRSRVARSTTARWPANGSCGRRFARRSPDFKLQPRDALVVCGGFHIFLDQQRSRAAPADSRGHAQRHRRPLLVLPHLRAFGLRRRQPAPRYYEMCFDSQSAGGEPAPGRHRLCDRRRERGPAARRAPVAGRRHRRHAARPDAGPPARPPRAAARRHPRRADHVLLQGKPARPRPRICFEAIDEVNIGTRLGRVTDRIGRLPIVNDFYEQLDRLELEEVVAREKVCNYALDKRQPQDLARSAFLHRLVFLGVEIGTRAARGGAVRAIDLQGALAAEVEPEAGSDADRTESARRHDRDRGHHAACREPGRQRARSRPGMPPAGAGRRYGPAATDRSGRADDRPCHRPRRPLSFAGRRADVADAAGTLRRLSQPGQAAPGGPV